MYASQATLDVRPIASRVAVAFLVEDDVLYREGEVAVKKLGVVSGVLGTPPPRRLQPSLSPVR